MAALAGRRAYFNAIDQIAVMTAEVMTTAVKAVLRAGTLKSWQNW